MSGSDVFVHSSTVHSAQLHLSFEMMPFVSRKKLRKDTVAVRQDVLIFGKPGNFMAEMHGPHALKQFVRKLGMSFS